MFDLLENILHHVVSIYMADKRPDARKFTIGCFLMVLIFIGLLAFIFLDVDSGSNR